MEKRLTKTDYLFMVLFIFMLVSIVGSFFFGVKIGKDRQDARYQKMVAAKAEKPEVAGAYDQQYLVSFYHITYLPFREFQNRWFSDMNELEVHSTSVDSAAKLKELAAFAKEKYDILAAKTMPGNSPLLQDAHNAYTRSLKQFSDALKNNVSRANAMKGTELTAVLNHDAAVVAAQKSALEAQKAYFQAMVKWNQSVDTRLSGFDFNKKVSLEQWKTMNLNLKNYYLANVLLSDGSFKSYMPQDLSIRIDELIDNGGMKKLNATTIEQTVDVLLNTDAVRTNDFVNNKSKHYDQEPLPQLPFFFQ
jgi:hypothetical protein